MAATSAWSVPITGASRNNQRPNRGPNAHEFAPDVARAVADALKAAMAELRASEAPEWMDKSGLCAWLGISKSTFLRMLDDGRLPQPHIAQPSRWHRDRTREHLGVAR